MRFHSRVLHYWHLFQSGYITENRDTIASGSNISAMLFIRRTFLSCLLFGNGKFSEPATCRYRKISLTDMDSSIFGQNMNKSEKIIIIIKRLTGSHHHHIGNTLSYGSLYPVNLIQHLRRKKILVSPPIVDAQKRQPIRQPA